MKAQEYCIEKRLVAKDFDHQDSNHPKHQCTVRSYLKDGSVFMDRGAVVIREATPGVNHQRDALRRNFFVPFLDCLHNELEKRLSSKACEILSLANVFHPRNLKGVNSDNAKKLAKISGIDNKVVANQFILFSNSSEIKERKKECEKFLKTG